MEPPISKWRTFWTSNPPIVIFILCLVSENHKEKVEIVKFENSSLFLTDWKYNIKFKNDETFEKDAVTQVLKFLDQIQFRVSFKDSNLKSFVFSGFIWSYNLFFISLHCPNRQNSKSQRSGLERLTSAFESVRLLFTPSTINLQFVSFTKKYSNKLSMKALVEKTF